MVYFIKLLGFNPQGNSDYISWGKKFLKEYTTCCVSQKLCVSMCFGRGKKKETPQCFINLFDGIMYFFSLLRKAECGV
jgi:hypothetical protein